MEAKFRVTIDARPETWGDAREFLDAPERGRAPRSKVLNGVEHHPDELIPETKRSDMRHREWYHIQKVTTIDREYEVFWVHGNYVPASHSSTQKKYGHFESWFLVVDNTGHFLDVPANLCSPAMS
jgi:hypothetical protein